MLKQLLISSLMKILKPGCPRNVESGEASFFMTLSPIQWVPVQDKGSKIPCVKFWAMKIIPSDCLHQEYLTINLGNTSD